MSCNSQLLVFRLIPLAKCRAELVGVIVDIHAVPKEPIVYRQIGPLGGCCCPSKDFCTVWEGQWIVIRSHSGFGPFVGTSLGGCTCHLGGP